MIIGVLSVQVITEKGYRLLYVQTLLELLLEQSGQPMLDGIQTEHVFADGVYTRQMHVKAGTLVIGKRHKVSTTNILLSGTMLVMSDTGLAPQKLVAPCVFVSPAKDKKIGLAITDVIWANTFATELTNVDDILAEVTLEDDQNLVNKIKGALTCQLDGLQLEQQ